MARRSDRRLLALEWPKAPPNIPLSCCRLRNAMPFITGHEALNPRVYCPGGGVSCSGDGRRIPAGPVRAFARCSWTKRPSRFSGPAAGRCGPTGCRWSAGRERFAGRLLRQHRVPDLSQSRRGQTRACPMRSGKPVARSVIGDCGTARQRERIADKDAPSHLI
jgi:hypothetical protein